MDYIKLYESIDNYLNEVRNTSLYKEYNELSNYIKENYSNLINDYKEAKSKYEDALAISKSYPGIDKLKDNYIKAKGILFSKEEIKEYFNLTHKLEDLYNNDLNTIKEKILKK